MRDYHDYSLLRHNTFGIEARCQRFLEYETADEARQVAAILRSSQQPFMVIGGGSNLLLTRDFPGIVVRSGMVGELSACPVSETTAGHQWSDDVMVLAGSGIKWDDFVANCISCGWHGTENLSLIPGDVGAAAVQNIGAYGVEAKDLVETVEAVRISDGLTVRFRADECGYGYRQSRFKQEWKNQYLITRVTFRLSLHFSPRLDYGNIRAELERRGIDQPQAQQLRDVIIDIRRQKLPDPEVLGNAGSFFMNPIVGREQYERLAASYPAMPHYRVDDAHEKIPAGWMIEQCGWKGRTLGRAGVHDRQALVLVNRGGATGGEVVALCEAIRRDVKAKFDIDIHPEVNIV